MTPSKLILVNPPSPFLASERIFMPLGLLQVATAARSRGHDVEICDVSGFTNSWQALSSCLNTRPCDVLGFTATTPQMPEVLQLARRVREEFPKLKLVLGGSHATLVHAGVSRHGDAARSQHLWKDLRRNFDVIATGDGILSISRVLEPDAPSVVDADDPRSSFFPQTEDLDLLGVADRSLLATDSYHYTIGGRPATSIMAQLGCPFKCGFCSGRISPTFRRLRQRSVSSVIGEIVELRRRYGYTAFMFYDDELNLGRNFEPLMRALARLGTNVDGGLSFRGCIKAELLTKEQGILMHEAGFTEVLVGVESGCDEILASVQKGASSDDNARAVEILKESHIRVKALLSIGHPGEDLKSVEKTISWSQKVAPDDLDVSIISPLPGSSYYDDAVPEGDDVWAYTSPTGRRLFQRSVDFHSQNSFYKGSSDGPYVCNTWTESMTSSDLIRARANVESHLRFSLGIPYPVERSAIYFDHSMGQLAFPNGRDRDFDRDPR